MKKRVDLLMAERGLAQSREKAKAQIIAGGVLADGRPVRQPSEMFEEGVTLELKGDACPYVSRGGLKLEKAMAEFGISLTGRVCADIGASTGGFTDCMLKNGAEYVYAVDVGYGQFDWKLRNDERVCVMERTNARYLERLDRDVGFASVDVSFISLSLIFPALLRLGDDVEVVTLIKPQFEAGKDKVGKKGVVKSKDVHMDVIKNVRESAEAMGLAMAALTFSPIKGPNGNIEYLAHYEKTAEKGVVSDDLIKIIVENAHFSL